ncbi:MAG: lipid II flippase MurJ [Caldilineaceae bacterium]
MAEQAESTGPLTADVGRTKSTAGITVDTTLSGRRLAGVAMLVMLFFVLSRVAGLAREVVIGARFGTSPELDAYLAAFRVPDILFQLVAGGALGSAFIPTFASYWTQGKREEAWLLFSRVLTLITLILIVIAAVVIVVARPLVEQVIAPGFAPAQQLLTARLMRWMLVSTIIFGASGLVMGALNAVQHFYCQRLLLSFTTWRSL